MREIKNHYSVKYCWDFIIIIGTFKIRTDIKSVLIYVIMIEFIAK